jgi:hypothetical protein
LAREIEYAWWGNNVISVKIQDIDDRGIPFDSAWSALQHPSIVSVEEQSEANESTYMLKTASKLQTRHISTNVHRIDMKISAKEPQKQFE